MMEWYHVSVRDWSPGHQIPAGRWGEIVRSFGRQPGFDADTYQWELALEVGRVALGIAPSRLDCVFVTETLEGAVQFGLHYRPNSKIYAVRPLDPQVVTFTGDFDLLAGGGDWLGTVPDRVKLYWSTHPRGMPELLVGGPVVVERFVQNVSEPEQATG